MLSIAFANKGQVQDTGAKMIHNAPRTSSSIVSKSIARGGGEVNYRGQVTFAKTQPSQSATSSVTPLSWMIFLNQTPFHLMKSTTHKWPSNTKPKYQNLRRTALLPHEPRPIRVRSHRDDCHGLCRTIHQRTPNGIRSRTQQTDCL